MCAFKRYFLLLYFCFLFFKKTHFFENMKHAVGIRWLLIPNLHVRLHKQIHIHKGIWTMFGVRWYFISVTSLVHTMHMEYLNSHFPQTIQGYSNLIHSYKSNNHNHITMSYLLYSHFVNNHRIAISLLLIGIVVFSFVNTIFLNDIVSHNFKVS